MRSQDEKLRDMIAEQAAEWHVAHSEGPLRPEQARVFMSWLRTSPVHVSAYLAVAGLARDLFDTARRSTTSLPELLEERDADVLPLGALGAGSQPHNEDVLSPKAYRAHVLHATASLRTPWRSIVRCTAVAAMLVVFAATLLIGWQWHTSQPTIESFATRHGQVHSFRLPDGTLVQLDADSAVTMRFNRNSRRVVLDRGQAYFEVAKDPQRPFNVQMGQLLVRDIGTAFDVYRHPSGATITVEVGRIQVWRVQPHSAVSNPWLGWFRSAQKLQGAPIADLVAGEQVHVSDTGQVTALGSVDVAQFLAWRHGQIAFDHLDIASVVAKFNRYNNEQISITGRHIGDLKISGTFDSHDVRSFVAFLGSLPNIRVEARGQRIVVSASPSGHRRHD